MARPTNPPWRFLDDSPAEGAWQMAVDEVLLESAAREGRASLRFYGWSRPTLSLGYFQPHAQRLTHEASLACPLVRRASGGGAIVHDRELTYSLALPASDPLAPDPEAVYEAVHEALARVLAGFGLSARRCEAETSRGANPPFLCFQRLGRGDVLLGGAKVCGSAQRRRRGAILQQGSLLLASSPSAPELAGLAEMGGRSIAEPLLRSAWRDELIERLGMTCEPGELLPAETRAASTLLLEKYTADAWNLRR